ncbi:hypothetical protein G4B88_010073 [Cannabis sativa]|uniref:Endonuclease/exonuclease/phosphatase domain-containing protein n=1 Tax=Cannabis sativa TaxID=3483 RepID=A0A7J6GJ54_CANSA|nr:hypothetical protein G4B88_010073 [Cannabis sativa]
MKCLAWNCRGLRRPAAERTLRGLSRREGVDVVFLLETKVEKGSTGIPGGFCVGWRAGLNIQIYIDPGLAPWHLFCIYGTPYGGQKKAFWNWLTNLVQSCNSPWALMGDLNMLLKSRGRGFGRMEGELLQNFLMDCDGIDLGYIGQSYAWYNARNAESRVRKRLDRAVACPDVKHFLIVNSDHAPLILDSRLSLQKHRYPFRFLEVWKSDNTCGKTIEKVWVTPCDGHRSFCVVKKLHLAKNALKRWNHDCFGRVKSGVFFSPKVCSALRKEISDSLQIPPLSCKENLWFQCPWGLLTGNQQFDSFESLFLWLNNLGDPIMLRYAACMFEGIWQCRNDLIFRNIAPDPTAISCRIHKRFGEFYLEVAITQHCERPDVHSGQG